MARNDSEDWNLIATAPCDGTKIRAAHFSNRFGSDWVCSAAFKAPKDGVRATWMEVDGVRGEVFLHPTHWQPLV